MGDPERDVEFMVALTTTLTSVVHSLDPARTLAERFERLLEAAEAVSSEWGYEPSEALRAAGFAAG